MALVFGDQPSVKLTIFVLGILLALAGNLMTKRRSGTQSSKV